MDHEGPCCRNSNLSPASAEESQSIEAAMSLLLDTNGNYVGEDVAIFGHSVSADNDTRAPKAFIQEQCRIIGAAAVGKADHSPDKGHVMKCLSNFFFKLKKEDASLRGVHALTPVRIKMIVTDISAALSNFTSLGVDDQAAKRACLDQIDAIILHHCGNHKLCKDEKCCTYTRVKNANPEWDEDVIAAAAVQESFRPLGGKSMSLSDRGIAVLEAALKKYINEATVERVADGGCSNLSENFWSVCTKFSEGKRLNQDHSNHYAMTNKISFCRMGAGNVEKTHEEVSTRLCLPTAAIQHHYFDKRQVRSTKLKKSQQSQKAKDSRTICKMTRAHKMGKTESAQCHKSNKVPLDEDAKSVVVKNSKKSNVKKLSTCGNCKQFGHTRAQCVMPPNSKRSRAVLVNFDDFDGECQPSKRKKKGPDLIAVDDWII